MYPQPIRPINDQGLALGDLISQLLEVPLVVGMSDVAVVEVSGRCYKQV